MPRKLAPVLTIAIACLLAAGNLSGRVAPEDDAPDGTGTGVATPAGSLDGWIRVLATTSLEPAHPGPGIGLDGELGRHLGDAEGVLERTAVVPEPGSVLLLGVGLAALSIAHRSRPARS